MCQPEQRKRYLSMANRIICKKNYIKNKHLLKKGVFRRSRWRGVASKRLPERGDAEGGVILVEQFAPHNTIL